MVDILDGLAAVGPRFAASVLLLSPQLIGRACNLGGCQKCWQHGILRKAPFLGSSDMCAEVRHQQNIKRRADTFQSEPGCKSITVSKRREEKRLQTFVVIGPRSEKTVLQIGASGLSRQLRLTLPPRVRNRALLYGVPGTEGSYLSRLCRATVISLSGWQRCWAPRRSPISHIAVTK